MPGTRGWVDVPATSGAELARALGRAGLELSIDGPDRIAVKRCGITILSVPLVDRLRPEIVAAVAKTAGLTAPQLLEQLTGERTEGVESRHARGDLPRGNLPTEPEFASGQSGTAAATRPEPLGTEQR
jgi:hypothetical protein